MSATETVRPWGISRMRPYTTTEQLPYTNVTIDPATQLGVFCDAKGQPTRMGKHGTSKGTEKKTGTNLDGRSDEDHGQDSEQD